MGVATTVRDVAAELLEIATSALRRVSAPVRCSQHGTVLKGVDMDRS